jgi:hypothetical protein
MRYIFICILFALVPEVCVCVQCDTYLSILDGHGLSIYLSMYLVCIYLYVPGPCRARGVCAGVCHVCVCVCVCVCVFELFCAGFESLLLDRCSRQSLIILRLF